LPENYNVDIQNIGNNMNIPTFEEYKVLPKEQRKEIRKYQELNGLPVYSSKEGIPSIRAGVPNLKARGPRGEYPHRWVVGPDRLTHIKYRAFHKHRAQAFFRGEEYELTFTDWQKIWERHWWERGRRIDNLVLTRIDPEKSWSMNNVELITRLEHLKRNGFVRRMNRS